MQEQDIKTLVSELKIVRVRYELPDTSAFIRYRPVYEEDPNNLKVHHYDGELPLSCSETGAFSLKDLVNELRYAYLLIHLFPSDSAMHFYLSGLDNGLAQLEFIGGSYDFNRLWITSGISNVGIPMAIFLGKRPAVNGQPSVTLVDHRTHPAGQLVYRAIGGAGAHVGEEFFNQQ